MKVDVKNFDGATIEELELRDDIFRIEPNVAVMHQALVRQQANARLHNDRLDRPDGGRE